MNQKHLSVLTIITLLSLNAQTAAAFCGFYVAKADALSLTMPPRWFWPGTTIKRS